jgi:hypothetical protein
VDFPKIYPGSISGMDTLLENRPTTPEEIELYCKWLDALESDEFRQARKTLRTNPKENPHERLAHCCLGVLCEVAGMKWNSKYEKYQDADKKLAFFFDTTFVLEPLLGYDPIMKNTNSLSVVLANLNDEGASFQEIADFLKSVWGDPRE